MAEDALAHVEAALDADRHPGWSYLCKRGEHRQCADSGLPCTCECSFHHPEQLASYEAARSTKRAPGTRGPLKIDAVQAPGADAKAGWSSFCRRGEHGGCETAGAVCDCPHHGPGGQRPQRKESTMPRGIKGSGPYGNPALRDRGPNPLDRGAPSSNGHKPKPAPPIFELVKETPADPSPKYRGVAELARPLLDQIAAAGDRDWFRICLYPSAGGAGNGVKALRKGYEEAEWEFRSAKLEDTGQAAISARWIAAQ